VRKPPETPKNPEIEVSADVRARELRFAEVPETEVRFPGTPGRESVWGSGRKNLPDEVRAGTTYRNVEVRLRIADRLKDIEPGFREDGGKG
jgi:hypothetical protein